MAEDLVSENGNGVTEKQLIDHENLQNLVNQLVKLPADEPEVEEPTPFVPRMTLHQIKAIKSISTDKEVKLSFKEQYATAFIQFLEEVKLYFVPAAKRTRCQLDGHECKHCGERYHGVDEPEEDPSKPKRRT